MSNLKNEIMLLSNAWYGDKPLQIYFPENWEVTVVGDSELTRLTDGQIQDKLNAPIGCNSLREKASTAQKAVILVDDLTRPTPCFKILPFVIKEIIDGGMPKEAIDVIISGGTHKPESKEDMIKKVGREIYTSYRVTCHDSHKNLVKLGKTKRGTPLLLNRTVTQSDLKIGIGCIIPHPAAGFSGGAKLLIPGVCGAETVSFLHSYLKGCKLRGGSVETDFRSEIENAASIVGFDFSINAVINNRREIVGLFTGDMIRAFKEGVDFMNRYYRVPFVNDAEIVISDAYPEDVSLNLVRDRGLWPVFGRKKTVSNVVIAACSAGVGSHELFPVADTLKHRLIQRLKKFRLREFKNIRDKIKSIQNIINIRKTRFMLLSEGISEAELRSCFPDAALYTRWEDTLEVLKRRHGASKVKVALFQCSPLYFL